MKATHGPRVLLSVSILLSFVAAAHGATLQAKVTEVQSGNTIVVSNINRPLKVRLKGIAPPEAGQPFSDAAREHLKALVMDKAVFVNYTDLSDGYLQPKSPSIKSTSARRCSAMVWPGTTAREITH
jgi:endonuclease YncB( thermonuclease family)